jgi:hypothetical protein
VASVTVNASDVDPNRVHALTAALTYWNGRAGMNEARIVATAEQFYKFLTKPKDGQ